jgi:Flp pilus assembly protein TadD
MPAVTLAGLLCGGGLLIRAPGRLRPLAGAGRPLALAVLALLGGFAAVAYRGNSAVDASVKATEHGKLGQAEDSARTASRWNPWSSEAWRLLGEAQLAAGDAGRARRSFRTALDKDPHEWKLWYDLARASRGTARARALAEATRLNRYSAEVRAMQGR